MNKVIFPIAMIIYLVLLSGGCGQPKATEQSPGNLSLPDLPTAEGEGFYLSNGPYNKKFSGQLVVWNPALDSETFASVLSAVKESIASTVRRYGFIYQNILQAEGGQLLQNVEASRQLGQAKRRALRTSALKVADSWFKGVLPDEANKERAGIVFEQYCEAKLWERAFDHNLTKVSYLARPFPAVLCEPVYVRLGLLQDEKLCSDHASGQNYFECLWYDGVIKTSLFQKRYGHHEQTRTLLTDRKTVQLLYDNIITMERGFLYRALLRQNQVSLRNQEGDIVTIIPAQDKFPELAYLGERSVEDVIFDVESGDVAVAQDEQHQAIATKIPEVLSLFHSLSPGMWVGEFMVNQPFAVASPAPVEEMNQEVLGKAQAAIPEFFQQATPEIDQQLHQLQTQIGELMAATKPRVLMAAMPENPQTCFTAELADNLACQSLASKLNAIKLIGSPKISKALLTDVLLSVSKSKQAGRDVLEFRFQFEARQLSLPITGCLDVEAQEQIKCRSNESSHEDSMTFDLVEVDSDSGRIILEITLDDPKAHSLSLGVVRDPANQMKSYNELSYADLVNTRFRMELHPNNLHGLVDILTGNVQVVGDNQVGDVRHAASLNMMEVSPRVEQMFQLLQQITSR